MTLLMEFCALIILTLIQKVRTKFHAWKNITVAATDGEPAMIGVYRGYSVFLKEKVYFVHTVHYVLYRQHLVANNRVVNYIKF